MSDSTFRFIDKNIKQQFVPFRINGSDCQSIQSFKFYENNDIVKIARTINILPESFKQYVKSDISYILQYSIDNELKKNKKSFTVDNLLSRFPKIQIREYGQDSTIDTILNLFSSFGSGWSSGVETANQIFENSSNLKSKLTEHKNKANKAIKQYGEQFTNALESSMTTFIGDIFGNLGHGNVDVLYDSSSRNSMRSDRGDTMFAFDGSQPKKMETKHKGIVLDLPYIIYYKMISTSTQNVYELPFINKEIYDNKGSTGWESKGEFGLNFGDGEKRTILKALAPILNNIKVNAQPIWKPATSPEFSKIDVTLDLFNDTLDSAISNFLFIHTIIPNNMWMQYGVYQYSPNLYDIQIDGFRRLFMCSCDINITSRGNIRSPSDKFFQEMQKHVNQNAYKIDTFVSFLKTTIKIPDIYTVKLTFNSLLPQNFNNYLFEYAVDKSPYKLTLSTKGDIKGISYAEIMSKIKKNLK